MYYVTAFYYNFFIQNYRFCNVLVRQHGREIAQTMNGHLTVQSCEKTSLPKKTPKLTFYSPSRPCYITQR